jgi:hypothetical protein
MNVNGMHKMMQLISNFLLQEKHDSFYTTKCSLSKFNEKQIIWKFQSFEILKREMIFLLNHWAIFLVH